MSSWPGFGGKAGRVGRKGRPGGQRQVYFVAQGRPPRAALDAKLAPERRFREPLDVKLALERQFCKACEPSEVPCLSAKTEVQPFVL